MDQYKNQDKNYFDNIKRNYDDQYQNSYVNPHYDGNRHVKPDIIDQLQERNNQNKKINAEYISQQMKIGTIENIEKITNIPISNEVQKISNIEGLTHKAEQNIKLMSANEIHSNILTQENHPMKEFIRADEPYHHDIGVTLNQINTFASKNTKILEGQNESIIPSTDQSEVILNPQSINVDNYQIYQNSNQPIQSKKIEMQITKEYTQNPQKTYTRIEPRQKENQVILQKSENISKPINNQIISCLLYTSPSPRD